MGMYLYVDDFLITFGRETTKQQLKQVFHELRLFSAVSGLQQNVGKSVYVAKGTLQPEALHFVQDSGLQHETKVRHLGVQMGHVSVTNMGGNEKKVGAALIKLCERVGKALR